MFSLEMECASYNPSVPFCANGTVPAAVFSMIGLSSSAVCDVIVISATETLEYAVDTFTDAAYSNQVCRLFVWAVVCGGGGGGWH